MHQIAFTQSMNDFEINSRGLLFRYRTVHSVLKTMKSITHAFTSDFNWCVFGKSLFHFTTSTALVI
jgi:hypothetical protein